MALDAQPGHVHKLFTVTFIACDERKGSKTFISSPQKIHTQTWRPLASLNSSAGLAISLRASPAYFAGQEQRNAD